MNARNEPKKLTSKQEKFALAYIRLGNATAAHRAAYTPKTMSGKTIQEVACRLVKHPNVSARISELVAPAVKCPFPDATEFTFH